MNTAFYLCEGFKKVGWDCKQQIELWLMEHILVFLKTEYSTTYKDFIGPETFRETKGFIRIPTAEEKKIGS